MSKSQFIVFVFFLIKISGFGQDVIHFNPKPFIFTQNQFNIYKVLDYRIYSNTQSMKEDSTIIDIQFQESLDEDLFTFLNQSIERNNGQIPIKLVINKFIITQQNNSGILSNMVTLQLDYYQGDSLLYSSFVSNELSGTNDEVINQNIAFSLRESIDTFHRDHFLSADLFIDDSMYEPNVSNEVSPEKREASPFKVILGTIFYIIYEIMIADLEE